MKIQEAYKQTEVGIIPDDWEVYYLSDIAKKITDGEHATPKRTTEGYYLLSARNIHDSVIDLSDVDFVDEDEYQRIRKRCNPETGDILLSCSGTIGRVAVLPSGFECVMVRSAALIKPDKAKINSYFIHYILQSRLGKTQILQSLNQGAQANLFINHIERLKIPLPPLPEQNAIAQSLSDVDALITALDRLITKKRNIKQGTIQQLLTGKKRLPGFSGEWEEKKLEDIADSKVKWSITGGPFGSNLKSSDYTEDGTRVIQLQNIGDGIFLDNYKIYTSENKANELLSCNIYPGEIILSKMGDPVARACFIPNIEKRYLMCSDGIRLVVDNQFFDERFIHDYINSKYFRNQAIEASTGSTRMRIGLQDLKKLILLVPPLPEQKAIADILTDIDAEIEALEQKRDKYKAIKQGMMQELLTGKTRLL